MAMRTPRALFYHIPKTGGTWVERVLSLIDPEHRLDRHVWAGSGRNRDGLFRKHAVPADLAPADRTGFAFCFVRHPVAWYASFWSARTARDTPRDRGSRFGPERVWRRGLSFEDFVDRLLASYPTGFCAHLYRCYTPSMDFVGRQERLRADLAQALTRAGDTFDGRVLVTTPARNVSARRSVDPVVAARIVAAEHAVIDAWYPEGLT